MEAIMNIRKVCGVLMLGALIGWTASASSALAQAGTAASKSTTGSAAKSATANTRMTPTKDRYWRHRGGKHPHYGSRRVRTQAHTAQ